MDRAITYFDRLSLLEYEQPTIDAQLHAIAQVTQLIVHASTVRAHMIRVARHSGATWDQIGAHVGTTRSAAQQRYPDPPYGSTAAAGTTVECTS